MSSDSPRRRTSGAGPSRLDDAPSAFLGPAFARLGSLAGGAGAARQALDEREPGFLVFQRREVLKHGGPAALMARARLQEEIRRLAEALIEDFRRLCAEGALPRRGFS